MLSTAATNDLGAERDQIPGAAFREDEMLSTTGEIGHGVHD